jgi:hypothetical protein
MFAMLPAVCCTCFRRYTAFAGGSELKTHVGVKNVEVDEGPVRGGRRSVPYQDVRDVPWVGFDEGDTGCVCENVMQVLHRSIEHCEGKRK